MGGSDLGGGHCQSTSQPSKNLLGWFNRPMWHHIIWAKSFNRFGSVVPNIWMGGGVGVGVPSVHTPAPLKSTTVIQAHYIALYNMG
jgi:hypothetical protein